MGSIYGKYTVLGYLNAIAEGLFPNESNYWACWITPEGEVIAVSRHAAYDGYSDNSVRVCYNHREINLAGLRINKAQCQAVRKMVKLSDHPNVFTPFGMQRADNFRLKEGLLSEAC